MATLRSHRGGGSPDLDCEISYDEVLTGVAEVLEHFVLTAAAAAADERKPTPFDGDERMSIRNYLYGLARGGLCSKECFILALVYGDRVLQTHPDFTISIHNVHRLILVSIMLASKVLDDFYCRNLFYANAGGLSIELLNELELTLVFMLDFNLQVNPKEFAVYRDSLRRETIVKELPGIDDATDNHELSTNVVAPPVKPVYSGSQFIYTNPSHQWPGTSLVPMVAVPRHGVSQCMAPYSQEHLQPPVHHSIPQQQLQPQYLPSQPVMPITIVPVPQYSMTAVPYKFPSAQKEHDLHIKYMTSHRIDCRSAHELCPPGLAVHPARTIWPC